MNITDTAPVAIVTGAGSGPGARARAGARAGDTPWTAERLAAVLPGLIDAMARPTDPRSAMAHMMKAAVDAG